MIRILSILPLLIGFQLIAQDASVQAALSSTTVTTNDHFSYQITADCDCHIEAPDLSEFDVLDRSQGQMQSSSNINGKVTQFCKTTITYVLRARKKGSMTIGKAKAKCENESKESQQFSITVLDADEALQASEGVASNFYKLESNKESVMVGEPFTIRFLLYTDKMPQEISNIIRGDAAALWRHPIYNEREPGHAFPQYQTSIKGKKYHVIELTKDVCFADQAGKLHIDPYYGSAVEEYGFLENKYMSGYSNSLDIQVKNIPVEKPENYYGLAGNFEITHEISQTSVEANRAIDMRVRIAGTGNFNMFRGPEFLFPKDSFLVSLDSVQENFTYSDNGVEGWVEYNYVITPTKAGEYHIAPFSFSYFDWNSRQMKSVTTHEFTLNVSKGKDPEVIPPRGDPLQQPIDTDIRHIQSHNSGYFTYEDILFGRWYYWLMIGGPLCFPLILIIVRRRRSSRSTDAILEEEQKTTKRSILKEIQQLKSAEGTEALKQLKKALEDYFSIHLGVGRSMLSKNYISGKLIEKGVHQEQSAQFGSVWDKIEMAQYAPMSSENISDLIGATEELIKNLNKEL